MALLPLDGGISVWSPLLPQLTGPPYQLAPGSLLGLLSYCPSPVVGAHDSLVREEVLALHAAVAGRDGDGPVLLWYLAGIEGGCLRVCCLARLPVSWSLG